MSRYSIKLSNRTCFLTPLFRTPMLRPGTFALTLLLSFLTALGPLSMDMYLPSLPGIGRALSAPVLDVLLATSSYLLGSAFGLIFVCPGSDRLGRRPSPP